MMEGAATFGWLCVETLLELSLKSMTYAATFGWLCVETQSQQYWLLKLWQPPSGGCVLKQ